MTDKPEDKKISSSVATQALDSLGVPGGPKKQSRQPYPMREAPPLYYGGRYATQYVGQRPNNPTQFDDLEDPSFRPEDPGDRYGIREFMDGGRQSHGDLSTSPTTEGRRSPHKEQGGQYEPASVNATSDDAVLIRDTELETVARLVLDVVGDTLERSGFIHTGAGSLELRDYIREYVINHCRWYDQHKRKYRPLERMDD